MLTIANDLLLGHAKPGSRKDVDFYSFCALRFEGILSKSDPLGSLLLTGKHFGQLKLHQWLAIIALMQTFGIKPFVFCAKRPSEDLIALHRSGHLTLITDGSKGHFCDSLCYQISGTSIFLRPTKGSHGAVIDLNEGTASDSVDRSPLPSAIQTRETPAAILQFCPDTALFTHVLMDDKGEEPDRVLMDYVGALEPSTSLLSSEFSERLALASKAVKSEQNCIEQIINNLDCTVEVKGYLHYLDEKAQEEAFLSE